MPSAGAARAPTRSGFANDKPCSACFVAKQEGSVGAINIYFVYSVRVGVKVAAVKVFENEGMEMVRKEKSIGLESGIAIRTRAMIRQELQLGVALFGPY